MPPLIAALIFALGIAGLFWLEQNSRARTSGALWIPVIWLSLSGSRAVSQWLSILGIGNFGGATDSADQYLDGSPVDRWVLTGLLIFGIVVLARRGERVTSLLQANWPILIFFGYCAISVLWSDFPDVAFKRWIKSLGDVTMAMLVLTDPNPKVALQRFFSRVGFILVPLSVLFIKYYPDLGRGYDRWTGAAIYTGVTYSKNILGMVCLLLGLAALWRVSKLLPGRKKWFRNKPLLAQSTLLLVILWLLAKAGSATSLACFVLGGILLLAAGRRTVIRRPALLHTLVAISLSIPFAALFLDMGSGMVQTLGRDPTLTGRTEVWKRVLAMTANPLIGTGFESFWLGKRLEALWQVYWWKPTEAHNGYIEVFLNLGWIGIFLLAIVLGTGYRRIIGQVREGGDEANLRLAFLFVAVSYNFTEAAFKTLHPVWIVLLVSIMAVPRSRRAGMSSAALAIESDPAPAEEVRALIGDVHAVPCVGGSVDSEDQSPWSVSRSANPADNHGRKAAWHSAG